MTWQWFQPHMPGGFKRLSHYVFPFYNHIGPAEQFDEAKHARSVAAVAAAVQRARVEQARKAERFPLVYQRTRTLLAVRVPDSV